MVVSGVRKAVRGDLGLQSFLVHGHLRAERFEVDVGLAGLREQAFDALLLFLDVVLDLFAENLDLGVVEFVRRLARLDLRDHHLGGVMLDEAFLQQVLVDLALERRVEDFLFDRRVDREFLANLQGELLLSPVARRFLELGEQVFDLAMVFLEKRDGILRLGTGHDWFLLIFRNETTALARCSGQPRVRFRSRPPLPSPLEMSSSFAARAIARESARPGALSRSIQSRNSSP